MKKIFIIALLVGISATAYSSTSTLNLNRIQQNRLNILAKQLKIPTGEYKLTVSASGSKLEVLSTTDTQVITKEVEVIREVPVEKIVEKIVEKPLSMCVDLSKANPDPSKLTESLKKEFDSLVEKNKWYWCSCDYMPKGTVLGCW